MTARVDDLWLETAPKEFCTEASTLECNYADFDARCECGRHFRDCQHRPPVKCPCPSCKGEMSQSEVSVAHKDSEGEITHWTGRCVCGARLTVFND